MWWTQPKLALLFVGANALLFGVVVLASDVALVQVAGLVGVQGFLIVAYARSSHQLGVHHLAGATEKAFEANIWNRRWSPFRDKHTHPPDVIPRTEGGSFYQQIFTDAPGGRVALYCAMSMWEGARFLWVGNTVTVAIAFGVSAIGLTMTRVAGRVGPIPLIASALGAPICVLLIPEAINIMLLKRSILRHGAIPRTAILVPRDAVDLGLRHESIVPEGIGREIIVILSVVTGIPLLLVVGLAAGLRTATLAVTALIAAAVAGVWFVRAFYRLLVNGIPFLHLGDSIEVSVALDLAHRQRARLSLVVLIPTLYVVTWYAPAPNAPGLLFPAIWLGYVLAITFNDQLAGYAGFVNATHFDECFRRSLAKTQAATQAAGP